MKESEHGAASECSEVKYKAKPLNGFALLADPASWEERGNIQDHGEQRECDQTSRQRREI